MSLDGKGNWGRIHLVRDHSSSDILFLQNGVTVPLDRPTKRCIVCHMEPKVFVNRLGPFANPQPENFLDVWSHARSHNNIEWQTSATLQEHFHDLVDLKKTKGDILSVLISNVNFYPGHALRLNFIKYLRERLEKENSPVKMDIWGKSADVFPPPHLGELPYGLKDAAMYPYKYTFNVENHSERNYMTEKIVDGIMTESLCFYWGCPNYDDYLPKECVITIPIDTSFEKCYEIITTSIMNNEWEKRLTSIRKAKFLIMTRYSFFGKLDRTLNKHNENDGVIGEKIVKAKECLSTNNLEEAYNNLIVAVSLYSSNHLYDVGTERYTLFKDVAQKLNMSMAQGVPE
jgi:hypothetical protein